MQKNREESIAYAMDFASYLISKVPQIDRIILHGSIARGDFDEKSDVDLFIDARMNTIEKKVQKTKEDYYRTQKYKEWSLKGFNFPFSCIVGSLESSEWKDLKRAIINTGIILYGKYNSNTEKTYQYILISFENGHSESKRISMYRKLFGFTQGKKFHPGIVDKIEGKKVGKGALLVPAKYAQEILEYFHDKKITLKIYDLWTDSKIHRDSPHV